MNKFDVVQIEIAKGGSVQQEILKLLCEIAERLENIEKKMIPQESEVFIQIAEPIEEPVKRKRGRPPKKEVI